MVSALHFWYLTYTYCCTCTSTTSNSPIVSVYHLYLRLMIISPLLSLHKACALRLWALLRICQKFMRTALELRLFSARLRSDSKGWREAWPSSRLTTSDIFGLSVGAAVVHSRAIFSTRTRGVPLLLSNWILDLSLPIPREFLSPAEHKPATHLRCS